MSGPEGRRSDVWVPIAYWLAFFVDVAVVLALPTGSGTTPVREFGTGFAIAGVLSLAFSIWRISRPGWTRHRFWNTHPQLTWVLGGPFGHRQRLSGVIGATVAVLLVAFGVFVLVIG